MRNPGFNALFYKQQISSSKELNRTVWRDTVRQILPTTNNDATKEPMFLGQSVGIARYDVQRYEVFEKLTEKQLSFFWRPSEIELVNDRPDFEGMSDSDRHIFLANIRYQTLLDSVQGRAPSEAYGSIVSLPELETWFTTWTFSETIHTSSYTHILRNLHPTTAEMEAVFNGILDEEAIVTRSKSITKHYDNLINYNAKLVTEDVTYSRKEHLKLIYLSLIATYCLEAVRFYVSFATTFNFREQGKLDGVAKIMSLIAKDESLHMNGVEWILRLFSEDHQDIIGEVIEECKVEAVAIVNECAAQEKEWAKFLFSLGPILGLNVEILSTYIDYLTYTRIVLALGLEGVDVNPVTKNPCKWMDGHLSPESVQIAPQEAELDNYLVGAVDANVGEDDMNAFLEMNI